MQEGGEGTIQRHSFIRMSKLPDVRGRITYISSHAKQENLYAVYETTDRHYWTELVKCNQQEFQRSGTEGKCIEAREFIIALPESFPNLYTPDKSDRKDFPEQISKVMLSDPEKNENWFVDFKAGNEKYIVFKNRILKYQIGNQTEKEYVCNECKKLGIANEQMNWSE